MSDPIAPAARSILTGPLEGRPTEPDRAAPPSGSFRQVLRTETEPVPAQAEPGLPAPSLLRDAAHRIARGELRIEQVIRQCQRGGGVSQEQLIALQAQVYRYTQEVELAAKLVDKLTGAVRQTLTSQQ